MILVVLAPSTSEIDRMEDFLDVFLDIEQSNLSHVVIDRLTLGPKHYSSAIRRQLFCTQLYASGHAIVLQKRRRRIPWRTSLRSSTAQARGTVKSLGSYSAAVAKSGPGNHRPEPGKCQGRLHCNGCRWCQEVDQGLVSGVTLRNNRLRQSNSDIAEFFQLC